MKISENKLRECLRKWVKIIISGPKYEEEGHPPFSPEASNCCWYRSRDIDNSLAPFPVSFAQERLGNNFKNLEGHCKESIIAEKVSKD